MEKLTNHSAEKYSTVSYHCLSLYATLIDSCSSVPCTDYTWTQVECYMILLSFGTSWLVDRNRVELHLTGLIGTASYRDMQKIRIFGFFFENMLHWQFEVSAVTIYSMYLLLNLLTRLICSSIIHNIAL